MGLPPSQQLTQVKSADVISLNNHPKDHLNAQHKPACQAANGVEHLKMSLVYLYRDGYFKIDVLTRSENNHNHSKTPQGATTSQGDQLGYIPVREEDQC